MLSDNGSFVIAMRSSSKADSQDENKKGNGIMH